MGRGISAGTMGIAIVAILAGLVGAYIVRANLVKEEPPVVEAPPPLTLPLAASDLPAGRILALGDIGLVRLTRAEVEERGYDLTKMMASAPQIIGRTLRQPVKQGQPFLTTALYLQGTGPDFTANLKPGYRAISLPIARDRGGALPVGAFVDVIFRAAEQPAERGKLGIPEVTVRLLEGLEVIHVADPPANMQNQPPTVSLAVTPAQADILQTTTGRGELTLVARPQDERVVAGDKTKPLTLEDVLGIERPQPQPVVLFATEIFRRGSRSVNIYRDDKLYQQLQADQAAPDTDPAPETAPLPNSTTPLDPLNEPQPPAPVPPPPMPMPPGGGTAAPGEVPARPVVPAPANDDPFAPEPPAATRP